MGAKNRILFLLVGMIAATACTQKITDTDADDATLRSGTAAWAKAFNAGDADGIVALYADDAVVMPPGATAVRGKTEIKAYFVKFIAESQSAGGVSFESGSSETGFSGDLAWHSGVFSVRSKSGALLQTGKYVETWHRKDGKWQMIRDIWNTDATPPA